jgi:hypothetical protein
MVLVQLVRQKIASWKVWRRNNFYNLVMRVQVEGQKKEVSRLYKNTIVVYCLLVQTHLKKKDE